MECSLTGNPLVKTYLVRIPLLHAVAIANQLRDWCESVITCESNTVELGRTRVQANHYMVDNGSSMKVSYNTCHENYDTEREFVDGVIRGCEFLDNMSTPGGGLLDGKAKSNTQAKEELLVKRKQQT